jgi:hypothetical protein
MSRTTSLLIGLFLLLAIIVYLILPSGKEREMSYKPAILDLSIDSAAVVKLEVHRPGNSVTIENIGGKWFITAPIHSAADPSAVAQTIGAIRRLKLGSLVSSNPERQHLFQVDTTGTRLAITDRSGKTLALVVGKSGPSYTEVYFRLAEAKDVYLGEGLDAWRLNQELKDWRDKRIFSTIADSLRELRLSHRGRTISLFRDGTRWRSGNDTVAANVITPFLNTLTNLTANDFVDTLFQPKTQPFLLTVRTGEETTLSFYPQLPDTSNYFVQTSRTPQGFILNKWTVRELMKPMEALKK